MRGGFAVIIGLSFAVTGFCDVIIHGGNVVVNVNNYCTSDFDCANDPTDSPSPTAVPTLSPTRPTSNVISTFLASDVGGWGVAGDTTGAIYFGRVKKAYPPNTAATLVYDDIGVPAMWLNTQGELFVQSHIAINKVDLATNIVSSVFGNGYNTYSGDNGPATSASTSGLYGIWCNTVGSIFVGSQTDQVIRVIDPAGIVSKFAGTVEVSGNVNGPRTSAQFFNPYGITGDSVGNMFIADYDNLLVKQIDSEGIVSTFAGSGDHVYVGENLPFTSTPLYNPIAFWFDELTNDIYLSVRSYHRVLQLKASTGLSSTYIGTGTGAHTGDGGPASSASIQDPRGLWADTAMTLYVVESGIDALRTVALV